jgi:aspartyl-tRNA(Asn)/glutamyl-tRNA(Gln) amidotransferase subunit A
LSRTQGHHEAANTPLHWLSLTEVARLVARGELSPVELVEATLERIERLEPGLNALLQVLGPQAREQARRLQRRQKRRRRLGELYGVPVTVKDILLTRDAPTTAGSRIYGDGIKTEHDALVVSRLRRAGAVLVGKNNLHEIALGITSVNEHFGPVRNPWAPDRVAGGSSGGSAAAVAAGLGYASIGTDTRGSVRIPAACCGVTGLKPTTGLVPTDGVLPLSWTLDHVGPLTRSVEDAALVLGVMTGGSSRSRRYREALGRPVKGLRIGLSEYHLRDLDAEVAKAVESAARLLTAAGARLRHVEVPELDGAFEDSLVIGGAEAAAHHERDVKRNPHAYGPKVLERLKLGFDFSAVELVRAERQRLRVIAAFAEAFREVDILAGATLPVAAAPIGAERIRPAGRDEPITHGYMRLTAAQSMGTVPAMSIPCGFTAEDLPIGLQLIAPRHREDLLFTVGAELQRRSDWHQRRPPLG